MKYLISILSIGAASVLISCGNGETATQTEPESQSTQNLEESIANQETELVVQTDTTLETTTQEEVLVQEEGQMSANEVKQILSNYDPENEKFRLAELERRRNLALQADPSLKIAEPQQVIAQERAKYHEALKAQKKAKQTAKQTPVKAVVSDAKSELPVEESAPVFQKVVKVKEVPSETLAIDSAPVQLEKTKTTTAKVTQPKKTEIVESKTSLPEPSKNAVAKPEPKPIVEAEPTPIKAQPAPTKQAPIPAQDTKKSVSSTTGVAKIKFEQETFAFDTIVEGDVIDYQFKFVNTGTRTVEILNAKASCGCTRPSFPFLPIEPGQEAFIGVKYDSRTKSGNQTPQIEVVTNFQDDPIMLYLKGFVKDKPKGEASSN